jgi:hypothetical protein
MLKGDINLHLIVIIATKVALHFVQLVLLAVMIISCATAISRSDANEVAASSQGIDGGATRVAKDPVEACLRGSVDMIPKCVSQVCVERSVKEGEEGWEEVGLMK